MYWSSSVNVPFRNIENLSIYEINNEIRNGGKFVVFYYCYSILFFSSKRPAGIFFLKAGEHGARYSIGYTLISILLGWWGIPFGIIFTFQVLINNLSGGKDVTNEIIIPNINDTINSLINTENMPKINNRYYCKYCGAELPDYAIFCNKCGKKIKEI